MTRNVAVGVSGRIGSGKTTLSSELAGRLGCPRASFGEYVRSVAHSRGLDSTDRSALQDLGDELIAAGWPPFVQAVLDHAGYLSGSVVVDGIRHIEAITTLRSVLAPTPCVVVAVDASEEQRHERLHERGLVARTIGAADSHTNESEVDDVIKAADYLVAADQEVDSAVRAVLDWLSIDLPDEGPSLRT